MYVIMFLGELDSFAPNNDCGACIIGYCFAARVGENEFVLQTCHHLMSQKVIASPHAAAPSEALYGGYGGKFNSFIEVSRQQ